MFPEGRALEFLIAAVVALIVVGPKDLPILLRKFGQFMAKLRGMAAEFRASFDEMARQSELDELRKEVEALRKGQYEVAQTMHVEVNEAMQELNQSLVDAGIDLDTPTYQYHEAPSDPLPSPEPSPEAAPKPKAKPRAKPAAKKAPAKAAAAKAAPTPKAAKPRATAAKPTAAGAKRAKARS
jgi:sec-independent protein translocase protein TatB